MVFVKIFKFILSLFFTNFIYCCYKHNNEEDKNNNILLDKPKNKNEDIKNEDSKNKITSKNSRFMWNNNNCSIKSSLLNLMILFDNYNQLFEKLNDDNIITCIKARKEFKRILNEVINIRNKYKNNEELIRMEDFYKRCHDYKYNFYKSITNDDLINLEQLNKIIDENDDILRDMIPINYSIDSKDFNNKIEYENEIKMFIEFRDEDLNTSDYKDYRTDYTAGFTLSKILYMLVKLTNVLKIENYHVFGDNIYTFDDYKFKIVSYNNGNDELVSDNMKNVEINDNLISLTMGLSYGDIGHSVLIFKDIDNKYYFDCCNKVIQIDYQDIQNKNFQKIVDQWIKVGNINYKFESIKEALYKI